MKQGKEYDVIFQSASGMCRIEKRVEKKGEAQVLGTLPAGQIFGEIGFLERIAATASIVADEEVVEVYEMDEVWQHKIILTWTGLL